MEKMRKKYERRVKYDIRMAEPKKKKSGTEKAKYNLSLLDLKTCMVVFLEVDLVPHIALSFSCPLAFKEKLSHECWDNQIAVEELISLCYPPAAEGGLLTCILAMACILTTLIYVSHLI